MHDAGPMGDGQSPADLFEDPELLAADVGIRPSESLEVLTQGDTVDELEDEVALVALFDEVVDPADAGVVEARQRPRLAKQPRAGLSGQGPRRGAQCLDGDGSIEQFIDAAVNGSHAALAEKLHHPVVTDAPARFEGAGRTIEGPLTEENAGVDVGQCLGGIAVCEQLVGEREERVVVAVARAVLGLGGHLVVAGVGHVGSGWGS